MRPLFFQEVLVWLHRFMYTFIKMKRLEQEMKYIMGSGTYEKL